MFLDPEPKRRKTSRDMSSGFFSSQRPIASTRDPSRAIWRQALHERSNSQNNQQRSQRLPEQSTVRLVKPSPSPAPSPPANHGRDSETVVDDAKEKWQQNLGVKAELPRSNWAGEASVSNSRISDTVRDWTVSESPHWTNEVHITESEPSVTLLPNASVHELPPPTWHRRSISSGTYSQSSTLQGSDLAQSKKSLKSQRYSDFSQISTLRGTPTPTEQENRARLEADSRTGSGSALVLQTLQEASPERPERLSTIRPVPPSESSSTTGQGLGSSSTEASPTSRPRTAPSDRKHTPTNTPPPRRISKRTYSTGSIPSPRSRADTQSSFATVSNNSLGRPGSQAISEFTFPQASSPNFIAYSPDSARPISRDYPLRSAVSIESINSRLQYRSIAAANTGPPLATSNSSASLRSNDTLPPLHVPKKRLRHKAKSESLASLASSSNATEVMEEEIDTQPYPKRPFSSHLSTIASESEFSRSVSQHLSHFSLGSGVLTGDDASSILPFSRAHNRRSSAPADSIRSSLRPETRGTVSSEFVEEAGDMTLGIYREESAVPQPLFRASQPQLLDTTKEYHGRLPPLPPIPRGRDSDENFDTLSALQAPPLRQQKSGRSLRQRSNSTPAHSRQQSQVSYVDSERFSTGSTLFPVWAKRFYSGTVELQSKLSLASLANSERRPDMHRRDQSSYTSRSITSRLGTGLDGADSSSPVSSHFLPSIFRPRTRTRRREGSQSSRSSRFRKSRKSRPSQDTQDSMAIEVAPPLPADAAHLNSERLPSGQPRWGVLKGSPSASPETQRRLPKKYSKQRLWDQMEFPRPMTKDRLSDFSFNVQEPHLGPSKRHPQRIGWNAPSFVSSLDSLVTSKHNRQILCFVLGFFCPVVWMLGAVLPLPKRPITAADLEKSIAGSEEDVQAAMVTHEAGDAEKRWREERQYLKGRWWRMLNRVMSVVGVLVIAAVIALAVIATT